MVLALKLAPGLLRLAVAAAVLISASPASAVTDIMWWYAMSGELGRQLDKLAGSLEMACWPAHRKHCRSCNHCQA